jgi:hypothetical protein
VQARKGLWTVVVHVAPLAAAFGCIRLEASRRDLPFVRAGAATRGASTGAVRGVTLASHLSTQTVRAMKRFLAVLVAGLLVTISVSCSYSISRETLPLEKNEEIWPLRIESVAGWESCDGVSVGGAETPDSVELEKCWMSPDQNVAVIARRYRSSDFDAQRLAYAYLYALHTRADTLDESETFVGELAISGTNNGATYLRWRGDATLGDFVGLRRGAYVAVDVGAQVYDVLILQRQGGEPGELEGVVASISFDS